MREYYAVHRGSILTVVYPTRTACKKEMRPGQTLGFGEIETPRQFWQNRYTSELTPWLKEVHVMSCDPGACLRKAILNQTNYEKKSRQEYPLGA